MARITDYLKFTVKIEIKLKFWDAIKSRIAGLYRFPCYKISLADIINREKEIE